MEALSRRSALSLAMALWAQAEEQAHQHGNPSGSTSPYSFAFFNSKEVSTLQRFASTLIPPSGRSGGAAAARVEEYIDSVLHSAAPSLQSTWRKGLAQWARSKDPDSVLQKLAPHEFSPRSAQQEFFVLFKNAVTTAFYTSEEGISKELGYQGLGFLREFKGWEGEPFQTPADYRPLLRSRS